MDSPIHSTAVWATDAPDVKRLAALISGSSPHAGQPGVGARRHISRRRSRPARRGRPGGAGLPRPGASGATTRPSTTWKSPSAAMYRSRWRRARQAAGLRDLQADALGRVVGAFTRNQFIGKLVVVPS